MDVSNHSIVDGKVQLVRVVHHCFLWVRCQACVSLDDVHDIIQSANPIAINRVSCNDKVVIKHVDAESNRIRWDRAIVIDIDDDRVTGPVGVYLPDTMSSLSVSFSSVYSIDNSMWKSISTPHLVGLHGGVPKNVNGFPDSKLTGMLIHKDTEFSSIEERQCGDFSIPFGIAKFRSSSSRQANLLKFLVCKDLAEREDEEYYNVLEEEGWMVTVLIDIKETLKLVDGYGRQLQKNVTVLPCPPIEVDHSLMAQLRDIRCNGSDKIEDIILPIIKTESHNEYNFRMKLSAAVNQLIGSGQPLTAPTDECPSEVGYGEAFVEESAEMNRIPSSDGDIGKRLHTTVGQEVCMKGDDTNALTRSFHSQKREVNDYPGSDESRVPTFGRGRFLNAVNRFTGQPISNGNRVVNQCVDSDSRASSCCSLYSDSDENFPRTVRPCSATHLEHRGKSRAATGGIEEDVKQTQAASCASDLFDLPERIRDCDDSRSCSVGRGKLMKALERQYVHSQRPRADLVGCAARRSALDRLDERDSASNNDKRNAAYLEPPGRTGVATKGTQYHSLCTEDPLCATSASSLLGAAEDLLAKTNPSIKCLNDSLDRPVDNGFSSSMDDDILEPVKKYANELYLRDGGDFAVTQSLKWQKGLIFGEGSSDIRVFDHLGDLTLHPCVRMSSRGIRDLSRPQSLAIPAILNSRDVMIVGPNRSKKTSAVVLPMVSLLHDADRYSSPSGYGPLCTFVAPTSERVTEIGRQCMQYGGRHIKVVTVHGGDEGLDKMNSLLEGCHILVTSPRCLLRLLAYKYVTDLNRLYHLVLDRFDVLSELFSPELRKILCLSQALLQKRSVKVIDSEHPGVQVVISCEKWTPDTKAIAENVLHRPILVFTSFIESAVLSRIHHEMYTVKSKDKMKVMGQLLMNFPSEKLAIACNSEEDVMTAWKAIGDSTRCSDVILAHEKMKRSSLTIISSEWKAAQHPLLIFSDPAVTDFSVTDADVLIHFSLPDSKSSFSDRYMTIRDAIIRRAVDPKDVSSVKTCIIVDEESEGADQIPFVVDFLKRLNVKIPPEVAAFAEDIPRLKEESKDAPFCDNILQTGSCFKEDHCKWRHALKETDQVNLEFTRGLIRISISHIHSAVKHSVRILEYNPDPYGRGNWIPYRTEFEDIAQGMMAFFSKRTNRRLLGSVQSGDVVAYQEEDGDTVFHRARIITVVERNHLDEPITVLILAVDYGYKANVSISRLFELPEDLAAFSDQSSLVYLAGLKPVDLDIAWSAAARNTVEDAIAAREGKAEDGDEIIARILFLFDNAAIVDDLRWVKHLKHSTLTIMHLRKTIIESKSGLDNPEYFTKMARLFQRASLDFFDVNNEVRRIPLKKDPPTWAHLPSDEYTLVTITDPVSPSHFYAKVVKFEEAVIELQQEIAVSAKRHDEPLQCPVIGDVCLWKNPNASTDKDCWNRCLIKDLLLETATILLVDNGDVEDVGVGELFEIPWEFVSKLPFQAIECSLAGWKSSAVCDDDWCEEAIEEFHRTIQLQDGSIAPFYMKVVGTDDGALRTGGRRYNVVMVDFDDEYVVNEEFNFGVRTINEFDVDFDELKEQYPGRTLQANDEDDWELSPDHPMKPALPNELNGSNQSIHMDFDELDESEIDAMAEFMAKEWLVSQGLLPKEPQGLKKIEDSPGALPNDATSADVAAAAHSAQNDLSPSIIKKYQETSKLGNPACQDKKSKFPGDSLPIIDNTFDNFPPPLPVLGNKTPKVVWLQDLDTITLRFMVPCIDNYELRISDMYIFFLGVVASDTGANDIYERLIEFFGTVEGVYEEIEGTCLSIRFLKLVPDVWPRLTYHENKDRTIVFDAGTCKDSDSNAIDQCMYQGRKRAPDPNKLFGDEDLGVDPAYFVTVPEHMGESDDDFLEEPPEIKPFNLGNKDNDL